MSKRDTKDLQKFLKPFPDDIRDLVLRLRAFVWDLYPECNELIYDNYNALALGWSPTEKLGHTFCSIAVMRRGFNVHFGFYRGSQIADPKKILLGQGNQYRYVLVRSWKEFPKTYIKSLTRSAHRNSMKMVKGRELLVQGLSVTKSISPVKREAARKRIMRSEHRGRE